MKTKEQLYLEITNLWKNLCKLHNELYDLTCDEYQILLESRIDDLEEKLTEKKEVIDSINKLELHRQKLVKNYFENKNSEISSLKDLLIEFEEFEAKDNSRHLLRFNKLLIDIIEKIQSQNKMNRIFLNKAHIALDELKNINTGKKDFSTYNAKGVSSNSKGANP